MRGYTTERWFFASLGVAVVLATASCSSAHDRAITHAEHAIEVTVEQILGSAMSVEGAEIARQEREGTREPTDRLDFLRGAAHRAGVRILTEDDEGFVASIRHRSMHHPTWQEPFEIDMTWCYRFSIEGPRPEARTVACPEGT